MASIVDFLKSRGVTMKYQTAIKNLKKNGWVLNRTKGSHHHFKHPRIQGLVTVPFHGSSELSINIIKSIAKMSGLSFKY